MTIDYTDTRTFCIFCGIKNDSNNLNKRRGFVCSQCYKNPKKINKFCANCLIFKPINKFRAHKVSYEKLCKDCEYLQNIKYNKQKFRGKVRKLKTITKTLLSELIIQKPKRHFERNPNRILEKKIRRKLFNIIKSTGISFDQESAFICFLPFTIKNFKKYIESKFEPWMNWDNWQKYDLNTWDNNNQSSWTWELDFIIYPIDFPYNLMNDENFKKCWDLKNLKPIYSKQYASVSIYKIKRPKINYKCKFCNSIKKNTEFKISYDNLGKIHISDYCNKCKAESINENKEYQKQYKEKNSKRLKKKNAEYYKKNKDKINSKIREIKKNNPDKYNEIARKYRREKSTDVCYRLRKGVSKSIWYYLNGKKDGSCVKYLPYTIEELKTHLEFLFEPWMSWNNWGVYSSKTWDDNDPSTWKWNIDHIIPQSELPYDSMEHPNFQKCWALENLRPYSAKQNILDGVNKTRHKQPLNIENQTA